MAELKIHSKGNTGYFALRNAILMLAIRDWKALCKGASGVTQCGGTYNFGEIERFFRNDCYGYINDTDLTGEYILDKLYRIPGAPKRSKRA